MISPTYAKQILNALFHTGGGVGLDAGTELNNLKTAHSLSSFSIKVTENGQEKTKTVYGVSPLTYFNAYKTDGYKAGGDATAALDEKRGQVVSAKKQWHSVVNTPSEIFKWTTGTGSSQTEQSKAFTGWYLSENKEQSVPYPKAQETYLGLFTKMPDGNGEKYEEPTASEYMRVKLHQSIVTGEPTIGSAAEDDTGKTAIVNSEIIMFPEITSTTWGTIVGFGIFEKQKTEENDTPILWGVLKTPAESGEYVPNTVETTINHVPLFRKNEFSVSLG